MGVARAIMTNTVDHRFEPQAGTADEEPSVDELFDVLTEARRRHVLAVLTERESPTTVGEVARAVAIRESDDAPMTVSESTVHDVHVTLHHVHLPKLDDAALVEYDRDERTVSASVTTDAVPIDIE